MRRSAAAVSALLLVVCLPVPHVSGEPELQLELDGKPVTLVDGLPERTDGTLEISRRDLQGALGVVVRPLRPRPVPRQAKRTRRRTKPTQFLLRRGALGLRLGAEPSGVEGNERFSLRAAARGLGFRLSRKGTQVRLQSRGRAAAPAKRLRVGARVPPFWVETLDSEAHVFGAPTGRWQLIVLFATWSNSRERLPGLMPYGQVRREQGCDLLFVALDLEGAKHVRTYAPSAWQAHTRIDRDGMLLRQGPLGRPGRWLLVDPQGWLRATGEDYDPVDWAWIGEHLAEEALPDTLEATKSKARALDLHGRAQHVRIDAGDPATARALLEKAWEGGTRTAVLAWHLARLHLDAGEGPDATRRLEAARDKHLDDMQLRRQLWALTNPERYYGDEIDTAWERKTKREENDRLGKLRKLPRR